MALAKPLVVDRAVFRDSGQDTAVPSLDSRRPRLAPDLGKVGVMPRNTSKRYPGELRAKAMRMCRDPAAVSDPLKHRLFRPNPPERIDPGPAQADPARLPVVTCRTRSTPQFDGNTSRYPYGEVSLNRHAPRCGVRRRLRTAHLPHAHCRCFSVPRRGQSPRLPEGLGE